MLEQQASIARVLAVAFSFPFPARLTCYFGSSSFDFVAPKHGKYTTTREWLRIII